MRVLKIGRLLLWLPNAVDGTLQFLHSFSWNLPSFTCWSQKGSCLFLPLTLKPQKWCYGQTKTSKTLLWAHPREDKSWLSQFFFFDLGFSFEVGSGRLCCSWSLPPWFRWSSHLSSCYYPQHIQVTALNAVLIINLFLQPSPVLLIPIGCLVSQACLFKFWDRVALPL